MCSSEESCTGWAQGIDAHSSGSGPEGRVASPSVTRAVRTLVLDHFITLLPLDPARLSTAHIHQGALQEYPDWTQPTNTTFLAQLGENLCRIAFPTDDAIQRFAEALATAVAADATLRLWLNADDPQLAMLPWEYLCLTEEVVQECLRQGVALEQYQSHSGLPHAPPFLALHPSISLVRQATQRSPAPALERIGVLRVLIAWSNSLLLINALACLTK